MNSEVYMDILPGQIQPNAAKLAGWCFTVQMGNDQNHTVKATQELVKAKISNIPQLPNQSPDFTQLSMCFTY